MRKLPFTLIAVVATTFLVPGCEKGLNNLGADLNGTIRIPDQKESGDRYNTFYGPVVHMGNGYARSWVNVTDDGKALAIGVEMTSRSLENLPESVYPGPGDFILPLHRKAKELTAYDHIMIDWNAHGHEPAGIYDLPHFDFHFYKISVSDQMAIPDYSVAPALFDNEPPPGYIPSFYLHGPGGVQQMGAHWIDLLSPEFNGQIFTETFLYGTYNGAVTFHEPMITMATIQSGSTIHTDIRQPLYFSPTKKYYPTRYSIWEDHATKRHYVSLDEMVLR